MPVRRKFYEINSRATGKFWEFGFLQLIIVCFFTKNVTTLNHHNFKDKSREN